MSAERPRDPLIIPHTTEAILRDHHFAQTEDGTLFGYVNGVYTPHGERLLQQLIYNQVVASPYGHQWNRSLAQDITEAVRVLSPQLWAQPLLRWLNLNNGLLDLKQAKLHEHSPQFLSPLRIPVAYDPAARCPAWEKFVAEVFPPDTVEAGVPWAIAAWLVTADISFQKALLLYGPGGTGKSTFLAALTRFLGPKNLSAMALHDLAQSQFLAAQLQGKLANLRADLPGKRLTDAARFKAMTGGDHLTAQRKFRAPFEYRPYARLVFTANELPVTVEPDDAYLARWIIVPMLQVFRDTAREVGRMQLESRLGNPEELSGLLNRAIAMLPQIRAHGLPVTASMKGAWEKLRAACDPVAAWLDHSTVADFGATTLKSDLLETYTLAVYEDQGLPPEDRAWLPAMSAESMGHAMKKYRPQVHSVHRQVASQRRYYWTGIRLRQPGEPAQA